MLGVQHYLHFINSCLLSLMWAAILITPFRMGKHKQVLCKVCYKEMRSDHLNRHMKVHETNDGSKMMRGQTTIDEKALEIAALKINKEYEEKIELGRALYKILNKGVVQEESFPPDWQKALDLYLKQGHQIDHETVVLNTILCCREEESCLILSEFSFTVFSGWIPVRYWWNGWFTPSIYTLSDAGQHGITVRSGWISHRQGWMNTCFSQNFI